MTWFHTPSVGRRFRFQGRQDLGRHEIRWGLVAHQGNWGEGGLPTVADRFENPLVAMQVERHEGRLGRGYRLLEVEGRGVIVSALKLAEDVSSIVRNAGLPIWSTIAAASAMVLTTSV